MYGCVSYSKDSARGNTCLLFVTETQPSKKLSANKSFHIRFDECDIKNWITRQTTYTKAIKCQDIQ